jgi:hypothetical protein
MSCFGMNVGPKTLLIEDHGGVRMPCESPVSPIDARLLEPHRRVVELGQIVQRRGFIEANHGNSKMGLHGPHLEVAFIWCNPEYR